MEGPGAPLTLLGWPSSEGIVTVRVTMIALVLSLGLMLISVQTWLFCSFWCQICYKFSSFTLKYWQYTHMVQYSHNRIYMVWKTTLTAAWRKPNKNFPTKNEVAQTFKNNYKTHQLLHIGYFGLCGIFLCNADPLRAAFPKLVANWIPSATPGFTSEMNFTLEVKDGWMVPSAPKKTPTYF